MSNVTSATSGGFSVDKFLCAGQMERAVTECIWREQLERLGKVIRANPEIDFNQPFAVSSGIPLQLSYPSGTVYPLDLAIRSLNCEITELLLKNGADVNYRVDQSTAFMAFIAREAFLLSNQKELTEDHWGPMWKLLKERGASLSLEDQNWIIRNWMLVPAGANNPALQEFLEKINDLIPEGTENVLMKTVMQLKEGGRKEEVKVSSEWDSQGWGGH